MVKKIILLVLNIIVNFYKLIHVIKMKTHFIKPNLIMKKRVRLEKKVSLVKRVEEVKTAQKTVQSL